MDPKQKMQKKLILAKINTKIQNPDFIAFYNIGQEMEMPILMTPESKMWLI